METSETTQPETGQVSSQAPEPKDENQNEIALAAKYEVQPRMVRLLDELIEKKLAPPEQAEAQEQQAKPESQKDTVDLPAEPTEQPEGPSIDEQTQERIKSYFKNLDPKAKLAAAMMFELSALDGLSFQARQKEGKLTDEIWSDLESTCIETYHTEPDDVIAVAIGVIDKEDIWFAGVWEAVRMVLQNC